MKVCITIFTDKTRHFMEYSIIYINWNIPIIQDGPFENFFNLDSCFWYAQTDQISIIDSYPFV